MSKPKHIPIAILAFLLLSCFPCLSVYAVDGEATGWWTDSQGNNYYGDPPSSSSSSSSSGSIDYKQMWADKWAAQREAKEMRKENARKQKAYDLNQKGLEYSSKDDFAKALEYYQKAAAVAPENQTIQGNVLSIQGNMWTQKGIDYYNQSDFVNAKKMFELALTFRPNDPIITANLNNTQSYLNQAEQENVKKQEAERQTNQVREQITGFSEELKERAANKNTSSLDFKGAAPGPTTDSEDSKGGKLTKFENMDPLKPSLIQRGPMPKGGSNTASGQGVGLTKSGATAVIGSKVGDGEMGSQAAGIGFDTAGASAPGIEPFVLKGIERQDQDPEIPQERISEFKDLVEKREKARGARRQLETKLEKMEQSDRPNSAEIVKMRDKIDVFKNEENFVNFSIKEKIAVAPNVKKGK